MSESSATLIGISNVATRLKARVAPGPDLDADPARRERVRAHARRAMEGYEAFIEDAIVHGRRVRLFTNAHHLADFWRDNFFREGEWSARTGRPVERSPLVTVYAMIGVEGEKEVSYFSPKHNEAYLFNTSYYGDLRATAMEALGRALKDEGTRVLHAGAVELNGRGLLILYPTEVIHPTPIWGLMELVGSRFVADGWALADASSRLFGIERRIYVRTSFIQSYPDPTAALLSSKFENVPEGETPVARLTASPDARAMADPAAFFGKSRVTAGPVPLTAVFALKAGAGEPIRPAKDLPFSYPAHEVHVGAVSGHPREVARLIARNC